MPPAEAMPRRWSASPPGWARTCQAVGAEMNGCGRDLPRIVTEVSWADTSTSTRWRSAIERQAATLASSVISSAAPVAK